MRKLRKIEYGNYIAQLRKKSLRLCTSWARQAGPACSSRKPRDPEEDIALFILDRKRWQQVLASGRLEKTGPRRYRWHG